MNKLDLLAKEILDFLDQENREFWECPTEIRNKEYYDLIQSAAKHLDYLIEDLISQNDGFSLKTFLGNNNEHLKIVELRRAIIDSYQFPSMFRINIENDLSRIRSVLDNFVEIRS